MTSWNVLQFLFTIICPYDDSHINQWIWCWCLLAHLVIFLLKHTEQIIDVPIPFPFYYSWYSRQLSLKRQERPTVWEHLGSPSFWWGLHFHNVICAFVMLRLVLVLFEISVSVDVTFPFVCPFVVFRFPITLELMVLNKNTNEFSSRRRNVFVVN